MSAAIIIARTAALPAPAPRILNPTTLPGPWGPIVGVKGFRELSGNHGGLFTHHGFPQLGEVGSSWYLSLTEAGVSKNV